VVRADGIVIAITATPLLDDTSNLRFRRLLVSTPANIAWADSKRHANHSSRHGDFASDSAHGAAGASARKEILWESETASDAEVRAMEIKLILETGANNPEIGYNLTRRWHRRLGLR
jgi:hypothetical protein